MRVEIKTPNLKVGFDLCKEGVECVEAFTALMYGIERGAGESEE